MQPEYNLSKAVRTKNTIWPNCSIAACAEELRRQGHPRPDVLLITGDAYVDHPSFGTGIVARLLDSWGLIVAVAAQPKWTEEKQLKAYGEPRLFVGVTAGNMDSMVNHLTAHRKKRSDDAYSPGGISGLRPNRASVVYAHLARRAFPNVPIILGGIESSLRRFAHYDYWEDALRRSVLLDAKADLLVYGMGERPLRAIVDRLNHLAQARRDDAKRLYGIRGTAFSLSQKTAQTYFQSNLGDNKSLSLGIHGLAEEGPPLSTEGLFRDPVAANNYPLVFLPSFEDIVSERRALAIATNLVEKNNLPGANTALAQAHGDTFIVAAPPSYPLSATELDAVHELPYSLMPHPQYRERIPAAEMIATSIQITRGCFGGCTFCALALHEGKTVQSRSRDSILREARRLTKAPFFRGTISDLGGATANMWQMGCADVEHEHKCRRPSCLFPRQCPRLRHAHAPLCALMAEVKKIPGVRHVHIASGIRHDLAINEPQYLEQLIRDHLGGHLHIAPEHADEQVLRLARKPPYSSFETFRKMFEKIRGRLTLKRYLNPYFVSGLPGSNSENMQRLVKLLRDEGWRPQQVQSFIPTPGTMATAMFYAGVNPENIEEKIEMPRRLGDKIKQHALLIAPLNKNKSNR